MSRENGGTQTPGIALGPRVSKDRSVQDYQWLTYLLDATDPGPGRAPPRVGDAVEFRLLRNGREIEAWRPDGQRLGRLPPDDTALLSGMVAENPAWRQGRITALVPRPLQGGARIHVRIGAPGG